MGFNQIRSIFQANSRNAGVSVIIVKMHGYKSYLYTQAFDDKCGKASIN